MRIIFANIYQGLLYEGKKGPKEVFSKYWPSAYLELYCALKPDIICLAEAPLDDESGNSRFIDDFAEAVGARDQRVTVDGASWLVQGKYYGLSILSKYKLENYQAFLLPNPRLEVDRPDGQHWVLQDKFVQSVTVRVDGHPIRLFNLHYYALQFFNRRLDEPAFAPIREGFVNQLRLNEGGPVIVTGDFNNAHDQIDNAFPELFSVGRLQQAVKFDSGQFDELYVGGQVQLDHVLYTPDHLRVMNTEIIRDRSDHRGVLVDFGLV